MGEVHPYFWRWIERAAARSGGIHAALKFSAATSMFGLPPATQPAVRLIGAFAAMVLAAGLAYLAILVAGSALVIWLIVHLARTGF